MIFKKQKIFTEIIKYFLMKINKESMQIVTSFNKKIMSNNKS